VALSLFFGAEAMLKLFPHPVIVNCTAFTTSILAAVMLSACGGGGVGDTQETAARQPVTALATGTTTLELDVPVLPEDIAAMVVQPAFHSAPVQLNEPDDAYTHGNQNFAKVGPTLQRVPAEFKGMSTRRLTASTLHALRHQMPQPQALSASELVTPMATGGVVATYSPAQIRSAYGLPTLPALGATPTTAQAAQMGAGQTIYVVVAQHNPNAAAELAAFNQKFGLPTCATNAIAPTTALPLPTAPSSGCTLSVVYSTTNGTMTSATPAYNSGWATEAALDVQWAHATAPMARIVLIEAADPTQNNLLGAIKLANAMGNGIVSMSFGAPEGSWTASVDAIFTSANMTYLAATGDSGAAVNWPAVSPKVVAVGGTTLTYSGTGARSEISWSGTGGGTSAFTATPSYQTSAVPGLTPTGRRSVADVAFNADPSTGQYVATMTPGSTAVSWLSAGGTSLSTPQWAGLIAVANATRAISGKPSLGAPHATLYGQIGAVAGNYASAFADITKGTDGACGTCSAKLGYDTLSGLGTPNVGNLLNILSGIAVPVAAPVINAATINGQVGTALSFTASATASNPLTYTLSGAPSGMSIASTGVVTWAAPIAGTYAVTIAAKDTKTGASGQGVYTVVIAAQQAPLVGSATITGKPGAALSFAVTTTAKNPLTYAVAGAPSGLSINASGIISWASPVLGTYALTVTAKDTKTGLTGQGVYTLKIATAGPVITAPAISGIAGKAISGTIAISDPGATSLSVTIAGAPLGMGFSFAGQTVGVVWSAPVVGTYNLTITVVDSAGLTAKAVMPIVITAK
jgi:hypothetical protein